MPRASEHETIPDGWQRVRLGDVAEVQTGGTPSRSEPVYWGGNIPWMASGEINQRRLKGTAEQITQEGLDNSNAKLFPPGTVMVAMNGQGTTRGKACVLGMEASCNQSLAAMLAGENTTNPFLFHVLDAAYHQLRDITGDGRSGLNLELIRGFQLLIPPLPEQQAIAAVLDSIDDAIEGAEAVITATGQLRDALLHDLLTRGLPGQHTEFRDVPVLGTIPADWEVVRLGDVAEVNRSNWDPSDGSAILYLDLTAVTAPGILSDPREVVAAEAPSRARRRVSSGDILVSTVRPNLRGFARVHHAPQNLVASTGFAVVAPLADTDNSFIYHHIMTRQFAGYLEDATTGQAYPAVRPSDVAAYTLPLPPLAEQQAIAAALDGVDAAMYVAREELAGLRLLKESTAEALLTGRVRTG